MAREEEEDFSSEVKPPLSSRVLLSRATAQKSPSKEVLKIRFVLGDSRIYCFNINILFVPPQKAGLYHRFPMAVAPAFPRFKRQTGVGSSTFSPPLSRHCAGSYLEVSGSLKGLVTDRADVAAVLPVGLSAVPPQRVGVVADLMAVVTLVAVSSFQLDVFPSLAPVLSDLLTHKDGAVRAGRPPSSATGEEDALTLYPLSGALVADWEW